MSKIKVLWLFAIPFIVCVSLGRVASGLLFRSNTGAYDTYLWIVLFASVGLATLWGVYNLTRYKRALRELNRESQ